jgi:hypothetical protein
MQEMLFEKEGGDSPGKRLAASADFALVLGLS